MGKTCKATAEWRNGPCRRTVFFEGYCVTHHPFAVKFRAEKGKEAREKKKMAHERERRLRLIYRLTELLGEAENNLPLVQLLANYRPQEEIAVDKVGTKP